MYELQLEFHFNISGIEEMTFYLHNWGQFFDPNSGKVFGSFSERVLLKGALLK